MNKNVPNQKDFGVFAIDIMGPLTKTKQGNRFTNVMTDQCGKLKRAVLVQSRPASHVAVELLMSCTIQYDSFYSFRKDNGVQFVSNIFVALCAADKTKFAILTDYHPQLNGQVTRFNKTLVARLRQYKNQKHTNWKSYVQPLTYG